MFNNIANKYKKDQSTKQGENIIKEDEIPRWFIASTK